MSTNKRARTLDSSRPSKRARLPTSSRPVVAKQTAHVAIKASNDDANTDEDESEDSGSDEGEEEEEDEKDSAAAMLAALEAHGRAMFGSLNPPAASSSSKSISKKSSKGKARETFEVVNDLDGIFAAGDEEEDSELGDGEGFDEDDGANGFDDDDGSDEEDEGDYSSEGEKDDQQDEEPEVPTVVFDTTSSRPTSTSTSKADFKRFMSSNSAKMMNIKKPEEDYVGRKRKPTADEQSEEDEDQSNAVLDKELHKILMTDLIPSSVVSNRPVEKRNQISSRLLELANIANLGQGSDTLHSTAYASQPTKIRSNILKAQERRSEKARAESQASGSWVKGSGGLSDIGSSKDRGLTLAQKKRKEKALSRRGEGEKGLGMGVGRFKGGVLTLSKGEIEKGSEVREKFVPRKSKGGKKGKGKGWD